MNEFLIMSWLIKINIPSIRTDIVCPSSRTICCVFPCLIGEDCCNWWIFTPCCNCLEKCQWLHINLYQTPKDKSLLVFIFSKGMIVYLDLLLCTTLQKRLWAACRKWDFAKTQNNGHFLPTRHCAEKICIFSRIFTPSAQIKKRGLFGCKQSLFLSTDARVYRSLNSLLFLSTTKKNFVSALGSY